MKFLAVIVCIAILCGVSSRTTAWEDGAINPRAAPSDAEEAPVEVRDSEEEKLESSPSDDEELTESLDEDDGQDGLESAEDDEDTEPAVEEEDDLEEAEEEDPLDEVFRKSKVFVYRFKH